MAQQNSKRKPAPANPDIEGPPIVIPVLTTGLGTRFYNTLSENRDKLHQVDASSGVTETKESVRMRAVQVAAEITSRGVKPNEVVLLCGSCHLDQTVAMLGCLFVGAIVAPVCPDLPYDEFNRIILDLKPKIAFCSSRAARLMERILHEGKMHCDVYIYKGDPQDFFNFSKCFDHKVDDQFKPEQVIDPNRTIAFIICTHGSVHEPKLVSLSHCDIFARYVPIIDPVKKKSEKIFSCFSLCWITQVLVSCICLETQDVIILSGSVTERGICKYVHDLRIEHLYLESDVAVNIVNNAPLLDFDLSCLQDIYIGGVPLSYLNYMKLKKAFTGVHISHFYKIAEVGDIASLPNDDGRNEVHNSLGTLQPGVIARLVDIRTRRTLGPDKWGELLVKSPGMMQGYYKNLHMTSRVLTKGFFKTGDIVLYDSEGYFYMKGRLECLITKDGHSFFANEIEEVLMSHYLIKEAVVFQAHSEFVACVILNEGQELTASVILDYVAGCLPEYKRPTKVKFYDHFPKTLHGVVKRYILKESAIRLIRDESFYHSEVVDDSQ